MASQPSASKTALLLNCQWSFNFSDNVEALEETVGEAPRYGSAWHGIMEQAPLGIGVKFPAARFPILVDEQRDKFQLSKSVGEELAQHVRGSLPVLQKWLGGKNPWDFDFTKHDLERETSFAIRASANKAVVGIVARPIPGPRAADHFYEELEEGEVAGTVDLMTDAQAAFSMVMDYKTGSRDDFFATPSKHPQMQTLGLIPKSAPAVAIFHADRRGLPVIYAEELSNDDRRRHVKRVQKAMRRVGDGSMRPGEWCRYCPARSVCPTQTAALLQGAASLVDGGMTALATTSKSSAMEKPEDIGRLHQFFSEFDRLKEKARPLMKARVKELLEGGKLSQRPDGKILTIRTRSEERLSKKAITDALGSAEAERLFEKLRKAGALVTTESEGLYAEFPD